MQITADDVASFYQSGYVNLKQGVDGEVLDRLLAAAARLKERYPFGFDHAQGFGATAMTERSRAPQPGDRAPTIIYHNAGFLEPDLLLPLADPAIHELVERIVGKDFYLSNVWMQIVPPGTGRMGYHKDEHGSVSITMPLDTIGWNSGSTCLVPHTHRNTPPPNFCVNDIMQIHTHEAQLTGTTGDIIFFTPEAWHGRAANLTDRTTCRLFFNFYSRSSRDATRWSPCITAERVQEVAQTLPVQYRHMLHLGRAPELPTGQFGRFWQWVMKNGSSSSAADLSSLIREYFYWKFSWQEPITRDARNLALPAYRTTITESDHFSIAEYLSHLHGLRTLKNSIRLSLQYWLAAFKVKNKVLHKGE